MRALWATSAIGLAVVAVLFAGSRCRLSDDTWYGLATGRLVCERGYFHFPLRDEFTFTFNGQVCANQHWLVHVAYWLIYDNWSPGGLVLLKLGLLVVMALCLWRTTLLGCGDEVISALAASAGLLFTAEYVDIRPNHVGFVCLALLQWLLWRVRSGRGRAIAAIPAVMIIWGNAHSSFLLGFAVVAVFLACEALQRLLGRPGRVSSWKHLVWIALATVASVLLVWLSSPYGWSAFTQQLAIMAGPDGEAYRAIKEWRSPFEDWPFSTQRVVPYVTPLWILLALSILIWGAAIVLAPWTRRQTRTPSPPALFDLTELALVGIGLGLACGSRRFIPVFVLLSLPVTARLLVALSRYARLGRRAGAERGSDLRWQRKVLGSAALFNVALLGYFGGVRWPALSQAYLASTGPSYAEWLFRTHTLTPDDLVSTVDFINRYGIRGRVFNSWGYAGYLMFNAPQLKVYIDGRSYGLFPAEFCNRYWYLTRFKKLDPQQMDEHGRYLDDYLGQQGVDWVLFEKRDPADLRLVVNALLQTGRWQPFFDTRRAILLVRASSRDSATTALMDRYWDAALDWPDTTYGWRIRARIWQNGPRPDPERALAAFRRAIELQAEPWLYHAVLASWRDAGRLDEGRAYFRAERARLQGLLAVSGRDSDDVRRCLPALDSIIARLEEASR